MTINPAHSYIERIFCGGDIINMNKKIKLLFKRKEWAGCRIYR